MYEQYDGIKQFDGPFSPHPEIMTDFPIYIFEQPKPVKQEKKITETKEEKIEPAVEEEKPETGLTVTNNVSYEIKDSEKRGIFKRR